MLPGGTLAKAVSIFRFSANAEWSSFYDQVNVNWRILRHKPD
jgi:hypothetical protein